MNNFYLTLIFIACVFDAMRDGFRVDQYWSISNRNWHIIKWIAFYPPLIFIALQMDFWYMCSSPVVGWIGWQLGLSFTPMRWRSMWFKYAVILFNKIKARVK